MDSLPPNVSSFILLIFYENLAARILTAGNTSLFFATAYSCMAISKFLHLFLFYKSNGHAMNAVA